MAPEQIYEGTFEEITARYGKELADRRVKVTVQETNNTATVGRPFYETETSQEWSQEWRAWAANHDRHATPLSDEAIDRDSIYEGRG